jgi:anthranilate/para-aminobenzoate synthase component I
LLSLQVARRTCTEAAAAQALADLQHHEGLYFGVDAGIAGLHPLQATLVDRPALRMRVWDDGLEVQALTAFGAAVARSAAIEGAGPLVQARAFLAALAPDPDVLLLGALRFDAHRLAGGVARAAPDGQPLGVLYFPERLYRRDAAGSWTEVTLSLEGVPSFQALHSPAASLHAPSAEAGDDHAPGGYAAMVGRALDVLRQRPLVSLTLSQSYRRRVDMPASEAFARLRAANPAPASFFLHDGAGLHLLGASPDLQLVVRGRSVEALPVCGTVARRPGAQGEAESVRELFNEEVDAAALAVCSDALRNDLAPLCEPGSLRLTHRRRPMALATVVHAVDRVAGTLREGADAWDAIAATAAPVMLTGTPRAVAVQAIAELEASPRGWYGGMVVQVASTGDALAGTILRAAAVRQGVAEVRTGGDLLADSSPEREEAESRLKTRSVWRAFGLEATPGGTASITAAGAARAVRLLADGDPFSAGLEDCLRGLGCSVDAGAAVTVLAGSQPPPAGSLVAIGDAAYRLLQAAGVAVEACPPEQGRPMACSVAPQAPLPVGSFTAGRYASHRLAGPAPGWTAWAHDADGMPVLLVRPGCACVLFRPDSLLADDTARALLAAAIGHVA